MNNIKAPRVEKTVTDLVGIITSFIGLMGLADSLLQIGFYSNTLPLVRGTVLSLLTIAFGVLLTTHGATRALKQLRKTVEDIKN